MTITNRPSIQTPAGSNLGTVIYPIEQNEVTVCAERPTPVVIEKVTEPIDLHAEGQGNENTSEDNEIANPGMDNGNPKATAPSPKRRGKVKSKAKTSECPKAEVKVMPGEAEAKEINDEHDALIGEFANFAAESVPKAIKLGEKLLKMKKSVGHGHWEEWVEKHLTFSLATAKRYMAEANPKRSKMSVLEVTANLMNDCDASGVVPREPAGKKVALKLFSPAAETVLSLPTEALADGDKDTIRREFERLEPIAVQLYEPSIFAVTWQKKLKEPPARWAHKDATLFKQEIEKAQIILAELETDAQFEAEVAAPSTLHKAEPALIEGDAS